jgi:hypothetical protein
MGAESLWARAENGAIKQPERMYLAIKGDEIYGPSDLLGLEKLRA